MLKIRSVAVGALADAAGEQMDAVLAGPAARGRDRLARLEVLGAGGELVAGAEQIPLLGQRDQVGAVGGGRGDQRRRRA